MRRLIVAVLVLCGVLVAADFATAAAAESVVSRQLRDRLALADDPNVRINGFPFLTQAVSGKYRSIELDAPRLKINNFQNVEVQAILHNVDAPLSGLLGGGTPTLHAEGADGSAKLGGDDLQRLLPMIDQLSLGNIDANGIDAAVNTGGDKSMRQLDPGITGRITGAMTVDGQKQQFVVIAELQAVNGQMSVIPRDIRSSKNTPLPAAAEAAVRQALTLRLDVGALPFGMKANRLEVRDGSLQISGYVADLRIGATPAAG